MYNFLLEKLSQSQCHQDQASENWKLQWESFPSPLLSKGGRQRDNCMWATEWLPFLLQSKAPERKIATWHTMKINKILFHPFGIKECI